MGRSAFDKIPRSCYEIAKLKQFEGRIALRTGGVMGSSGNCPQAGVFIINETNIARLSPAAAFMIFVTAIQSGLPRICKEVTSKSTHLFHLDTAGIGI